MINVVHVWGTPYERGFAQGQLLAKEAKGMATSVWAYFEEQVAQGINSTLHLPPDVLKVVAEIGLDVLLDLTYDATVKYTGEYFFQELQGLSDAAGVDYKTIRRIHMIGELTKGSCSMYGAWGKATASLGGKLMQLRALDWDVEGPFKNFPQITVYHSTDPAKDGNTFANIGWTGWVGSITGMSAQQMAICEIGVSFPDNTFGNESRIGVPFTFLLRDVLQWDKTLDDAIDHISNANRTCDLILGVGDAKPGGGFRGVQYSHSVANFFTDTNMKPEASWHPRIENVVYYGMDWTCPNFDIVLARQLNAYHGNITAENTIRYITPIVQTGNLHVAVYDLADNVLYTANARGDGESGPEMAYDRHFVRLDMAKLYAEPAPTNATAISIDGDDQ
eukprot:TRINITY_DN53706_c0_g1_i2.p1 TRINITY_DN53706_c0_g1~~TRINITY_DN53706_c0_g1_i2.p1  ORF type:complete len:391 (-),score=214.95 TRINITY_DN53706_c0_g1_i2:109-1281(-)